MALFRGIQEYIALDANNITLVFDSGNIVNISGNIFLYPPQGHPILYKYFQLVETTDKLECIISLKISASITKIYFIHSQFSRQWAIIFLSKNGFANSANCTFVWYLIKCY